MQTVVTSHYSVIADMLTDAVSPESQADFHVRKLLHSNDFSNYYPKWGPVLSAWCPFKFGVQIITEPFFY